MRRRAAARPGRPLVLAALASPARAQVAGWPAERPPAALAAHEVHFPAYEMRTLDNGLRVMVVPHHEQPAVSLRLLVEAGGAQDPPRRPGVANLMAQVLDQGTTTRSAEDIQRTIDDIGGALGVGAGTDLSFVNAVVMKPDFGLALTSCRTSRAPGVRAQEIERQRSQLLSGLRVSRDDPEYIADTVFDRLVYGFHPYGRPSSGTPESVPAITRDDLVAFHDRYFAPNNAILAIVGDVTPEEALAGAVRVFGGWQRRDVERPSWPTRRRPTRRVVVVDRPGAVQTEIRVGLIGVPRKSPDYMALNLAVRVLGGEGANRLQRVLRSKRGLTYGASADFDTLRQSGDIEAQTNTRSSATGEALRVIVDEFWRLRRERVNRAELEGAQDYLAGSFPLTIETPSQIALQILNHVFYGIDLKNLDDFPERVNAVTPGDIQRVAERYIQPDRLAIVLVGDADPFVSQLKGAGFDTYERVALDRLDLDQADLTRPAGAGPPAAARPPRRRRRTRARPPRPRPDAAAPGRELVERAIAAKGGVDALRAVRTVKAAATTTLSTPQGTIPVETTTYIAYPDRFRVEAQSPAGALVQVYDAGQAWLRDPNGVREAPPAMRDDFAASVARDLVPLLLRIHDGQAEVHAIADVAGEDGGRGPPSRSPAPRRPRHAALRPGVGAGRGRTLHDGRPGRRARRRGGDLRRLPRGQRRPGAVLRRRAPSGRHDHRSAPCTRSR